MKFVYALCARELDDEDEMLYGNAMASVFDPPTSFQAEQQKQKNKWYVMFMLQCFISS
jgi:hypothetical protein